MKFQKKKKNQRIQYYSYCSGNTRGTQWRQCDCCCVYAAVVVGDGGTFVKISITASESQNNGTGPVGDVEKKNTHSGHFNIGEKGRKKILSLNAPPYPVSQTNGSNAANTRASRRALVGTHA